MKSRLWRYAIFLFGFLVVVLAMSGFVLKSLLLPINPQNTAEVRVVVPKGSGVSAIGTLLEKKNLIRSSYLFRLVVWKLGIANNMQAGTFSLNQGMSIQEIAVRLTKGTEDVWITIPEGWRNEEIADVLEESLGTSFKKDEFLSLAKGKQGYLFPETYLLPKEATASLIVTMMQHTFDKRVTDDIQMNITQQHRTLHDVLTLASIVEREAKKPEDMKIVAGILLHRIALGWPLQVDATLQYIKGYDAKQKTWWPQPLIADKQLKSAYNTYAHPGLPPGPIANPGLAAIEAVVAPTSTDYLFYLTDNKGVMHYAKTVEEHNANVRTYIRQ